MSVGMDERVMFTETKIAGASILSLRTTMQHGATPEGLPKLAPSWRLKAIPKVTGEGVDVLQIVDVSSVGTDVTFHAVRRGEGVVEFAPSPIYDLSDFTPLEYFGASYVEMDYTEGYGQIVSDLLREG